LVVVGSAVTDDAELLDTKSVIPYPAIVVGFPVTPVHGALVAVVALPVRFPTKVGAVTVPAIVALPESQRSAHLLPVAPISFADDVAKGKRLPEIVRFCTVRFTSVSVMTLPCTVRSPVIRVAPDTVSFAVGLFVPIPTLPVVVLT
jgi:hypothetical protein